MHQYGIVSNDEDQLFQRKSATKAQRWGSVGRALPTNLFCVRAAPAACCSRCEQVILSYPDVLALSTALHQSNCQSHVMMAPTLKAVASQRGRDSAGAQHSALKSNKLTQYLCSAGLVTLYAQQGERCRVWHRPVASSASSTDCPTTLGAQHRLATMQLASQMLLL